MEAKNILEALAQHPNGVTFLYLTPGQSLHSGAENPRREDYAGDTGGR